MSSYSPQKEWDDMQGINKNHLIVNGSSYEKGASTIGSKSLYEYFDHPDADKRTKGEYDKYEFELYTHPSGEAKDGSIKLNMVNLQFMLGVKDPGAFGVDQTQTDIGQALISSIDTNGDGLITGEEWGSSEYDTTENDTIDADEITAFQTANSGWEISVSGNEATDSGLDTNADGLLSDAELLAFDADGDPATNDGYDLDGNGEISAAELAATGLDTNDDGLIGDSIGSFTDAPALYTEGAGNSISISNTINLAGLNQPTLDPNDGSVHLSNDGTDYSSFLNEDGFIKDIQKITIDEFTNIIEKIADARAENGAEQARIGHSMGLHQNNLVNLQSAHGRIMDVDVAMESTRLARHSVNVQVVPPWLHKRIR